MQAWLRELIPPVGPEVFVRFARQGIDIEALALLNDSHLIDLGLGLLGWRVKLMDIIRDHKLNPTDMFSRERNKHFGSPSHEKALVTLDDLGITGANYFLDPHFKPPTWLKFLALDDAKWFNEGFVTSFMDNYKTKTFFIGSEGEMRDGKPIGHEDQETLAMANETKRLWLASTAESEFATYVVKAGSINERSAVTGERRFGVKLMLGDTAVGAALFDVFCESEAINVPHESVFSHSCQSHRARYVLYLSQVFILPGFQRRGYGTMLHTYICNFARDNLDVSKVEVLARVINEAAYQLYRKVGMEFLSGENKKQVVTKYAYSPTRYFAAVKALKIPPPQLL